MDAAGQEMHQPLPVRKRAPNAGVHPQVIQPNYPNAQLPQYVGIGYAPESNMSGRRPGKPVSAPRVGSAY